MILNNIDLGGSHPFQATHIFHVLGTELIEGYDTAIWPRGSNPRQEQVTFWLQPWQAIGGAAANSRLAAQYLIKQVEELVANRDMQPAYIQWTATAQPGAALNATELHDGWYVINEFKPDYTRYVVSGIVQCSMTVTHVADAPPRRVALAYSGAALSTNFSGGATNLVASPVGSVTLDAGAASLSRTGAEGVMPVIISPNASPWPFVLSATIANWFKGGVHVYDTINTGSNAVPSAASGLFVNTNWVEVFDTHHDFQGDCVLTNGLQLLLFQVGVGQLCKAYLWNTAAANIGWQLWGTPSTEQVASQNDTTRAYSLVRVGPEECAITVTQSTAGGNAGLYTVRLQRARYEARVDYRPLTNAEAHAYTIYVIFSANEKIVYNSGHISDNPLSEAAPAVVTDYGYGAAFINSAGSPFIAGLLYQNQPPTLQPGADGAANYIQLNDTTSLAINAQRSYGFFAVPFGVSGTYSTANLQAEAESGTLGTGWTSIVDAAASGGNAANLANGTASGNADLWGTSFVPAAGVYDLWVRMKTTTHTSATAQLQIGLWDATSAAFVTSTTYAPNQTTGSYAWYRVAASVTPTATHNMQVRAVTTATTTDAWQLDESALVPHTLSTANTGPQDTYQIWAYDRSARWVRQ